MLCAVVLMLLCWWPTVRLLCVCVSLAAPLPSCYRSTVGVMLVTFALLCCWTTVKIISILCGCEKKNKKFHNHEGFLPSDGKYMKYRYVPKVTKRPKVPCRIVQDVNKYFTFYFSPDHYESFINCVWIYAMFITPGVVFVLYNFT